MDLGHILEAIARDLGAVLQTGGTLAALTRTASSGFDLAESLTLSDLETQLQAGTFQPIPLMHLCSIYLQWFYQQHLLKNGVKDSEFP